jgi:hypothetical protein
VPFANLERPGPRPRRAALVIGAVAAVVIAGILAALAAGADLPLIGGDDDEGGSAGGGGPGTHLIAAGDIADCNLPGDEATAVLVARMRGTVATLGDNAYEDGKPEEFASCYAPSWGQFKARTKPAPGNHEYHTDDAEGYFEYFGAAAGDPDEGYYSYELGRWHVIVINSNCDEVGGCGEGSPQERWLRNDLREHPARCTLAYWHHARFSSGGHPNADDMEPIWQALYDAGADVVLSSHAHIYERFAPQTPQGEPDRRRGIRQFTVGTGGRTLHPLFDTKPNSEVRNNKTFGVLSLTMRPTGYDWRFVPASGSFSDRGTDICH